MLFLSLLRQMEHCLQCMRRFGLVPYLNWISALFYFFPHAIDWKSHVEHGISLCMCVNVSVCLCMHTLVSTSHSIWKGDILKKSIWISQALDNPQQEYSSQHCVNKRNSMWQWLKWLKFQSTLRSRTLTIPRPPSVPTHTRKWVLVVFFSNLLQTCGSLMKRVVICSHKSVAVQLLSDFWNDKRHV